MDTPGFLDIKLSESRITKMISEKLDEIRQFARLWVSIFYFQPITDIRMGGSKRHAIKLLRAFADSFEANHVNIITTMWNRISNSKQREAAQQRYGALREEVYKSSDKLDIKITKYEFSTQSALFILDSNWYGWNYKKEDTGKGVDLEWRYLVRNNLVERITMKQQQLQLLAQDKELATTPGSEDYPLLEILRRDERAALTALQSFLDDLFEIDPEAARACSAPPPDPNLPGTSRILPSSESNLPVISRILPSSSLRESSHILPSYSPPVEAAQPFPPRPLKPLRPNRASYNLPSASLPLVLPPLEVPQDPSFQAALTTRFKRFSAPLKRVFVFKGTK
ncbi:hypothetical protein BJ165DRAFT_1449023 [Panaeolus papilionaceus]|nr:hypothetical protein BJ165DRAFT_1449023 [Panaeolus papilionaceus]